MPLFPLLEDGFTDDSAFVLLSKMEPLRPWQESIYGDSIACPCGNEPSNEGFDNGVFDTKGKWYLVRDAWTGLVQCQRCGLVYDCSDETKYFWAPDPEKGCRYCACKYAHGNAECPNGDKWHPAYIRYAEIYRDMAPETSLHWTLSYCVMQQASRAFEV